MKSKPTEKRRTSAVFVAGGTSGINLEIAMAFAKQGAVVGVASRTPEKVEAACSAISGFGKGALGFVMDVRDADAVDEAVTTFAQEVGHLDTVISGAAGNFVCAAADMTSNGFRTVVDIDLIGAFNVARAAYPHLRVQGGSIIHISAPQASVAVPGQAHACAAKAGVEMLTRCLALEWGVESIRVNAVVPGPIEGTEGMSRLAPDEKARTEVTRAVPMRRWGRAVEIADLCVFLAGETAGYVNGAVINVDGGWTIAGAGMPTGEIA